MTDTTPTPEQPDRASSAEIYRLIADSIAAGLPALKSLTIRPESISIDFNSVADRITWQPVFGMADVVAHEQPWPLDEPFQKWTTSVFGQWRGWWLTLDGDDPVTDEHRQWWIESGQAERRAAYLDREAAKRGEA